MMQTVSKQQFIEILNYSKYPHSEFFDVLYHIYSTAFEAIKGLAEAAIIDENTIVNNIELTYYVLGEFTYTTSAMTIEKIKQSINDENFVNSLATLSADKYVSLNVFHHIEEKSTNKYMPPESTIGLYLNYFLKTLEGHKKNNPSETLINDLLIKSFSIANCILELINNGYESTAFSAWRTLHECECTILILAKYGDVAINSYLKHMSYGIVLKEGAGTKEKTDQVFEKLKEEMHNHDLKSKDMKKFIEYGWLYAIDEFKNNPNAKLNFRDGMQPLAHLDKYSKSYVQSSELIHCTPSLIYSNKTYYYFITLLSLYESFFRLESVFCSFIDQYLSKDAISKYLRMKAIYYNQLVEIHKIESMKFKNFIDSKNVKN